MVLSQLPELKALSLHGNAPVAKNCRLSVELTFNLGTIAIRYALIVAELIESTEMLKNAHLL